MRGMALDEWKEAYRRLDPASRKELARWIVEQELGVSGGASAAAPRPGVPGWLKVAGAALGVAMLAGGLTWAGVSWVQEQKAAEARMSEAERLAAEAQRPRSPRNLEALRQQLGREVTVVGVPVLAEVGMLYFAQDKTSALRLNLMPAGVVLMQSGELEALVAAGTELTVTGVVTEAAGGQLEIKITGLGQMKMRGKE